MSNDIMYYGISGCGVFKGYKIRKVFGYKSTAVKWNYWILRIGVVASCQKLGIILENKVILKLMLSKNVNNKKWAPKSTVYRTGLQWK